jgi:hypothetical protein
MQIRTFKLLENNVFKVRIETADFSEQENENMVEFGEPEVEIGDDFTGPPAFTLETRLVLLKNGSPFSQSFDTRDELTPQAAEDKANVWAVEVVDRIKTAVTALRALTDDFSGETLETF